MASTASRILWLYPRTSSFKTFSGTSKKLFCTKQSDDGNSTQKLGGFAQSYIKQSRITEEKVPKEESFASLLRKSKFVDLGDPEGKIVVGTIYHVMGDDLYIDFGWKFPTVCTAPKKNKHLYKRGAKVKLHVKDLELSTRFLGATKDITLLEADCVLLGLDKSDLFSK
ncbi:hypothetical protein RUM43_001357 [Polyplax serrata]|uniref:28S ribosomal protein S28, mitochondrial n=1 Tax=Polyplax serrata TaxID=468196 RepID=A0AAN8SG50_POLSC